MRSNRLATLYPKLQLQIGSVPELLPRTEGPNVSRRRRRRQRGSAGGRHRRGAQNGMLVNIYFAVIRKRATCAFFCSDSRGLLALTRHAPGKQLRCTHLTAGRIFGVRFKWNLHNRSVAPKIPPGRRIFPAKRLSISCARRWKSRCAAPNIRAQLLRCVCESNVARLIYGDLSKQKLQRRKTH